MNRSFKIQFHNGEQDKKNIVTMSFSVTNNKRFHKLDEQGRKHLVENLAEFIKKVETFKSEVEAGRYQETQK